MRIAQVAPLYESVPPKLYGGTERVVSYLTEELVRQGHEVTLFASGDSQTQAQAGPGLPAALWRDPSCRETLPHHVRLMELVFADVSRFDVIHFHCDYVHFPLLRRLPCPSVTTLHGRLHLPDVRAALRGVRRGPAGLDLRRPAPADPAGQLAGDGLPRPAPRPAHLPRTAGRLPRLPGPHLAREGAGPGHRDRPPAGMPLKVAAKIYPEERDYYEQTIEPLLARVAPWSSSSARSAARRRTTSSATPTPCCSRSTGRSRSAW